MLIHKLRLTAMSVLLLTAVATGAGWLARSMAMPEDPRSNRRPRWRRLHPAAPISPGPIRPIRAG